MNLRVTRSKVLLSSGLGRTWQVRRFSLAGGRLIWRHTAVCIEGFGQIPTHWRTLISVWILGNVLGPCILTVLCEIVRQPNFTPHFLFCHTFLILGGEEQTGKNIQWNNGINAWVTVSTAVLASFAPVFDYHDWIRLNGWECVLFCVSGPRNIWSPPVPHPPSLNYILPLSHCNLSLCMCVCLCVSVSVCVCMTQKLDPLCYPVCQ